jgi:hypothetical protein
MLSSYSVKHTIARNVGKMHFNQTNFWMVCLINYFKINTKDKHKD